jgi:N-acetyl sugar amidotransferase
MMIKSIHDPNYKQCKISVMDNIADPLITFDEKGISNYYYEYLTNCKENVYVTENGFTLLNNIIDEIKAKGKGKIYDCIIGVSGGVDSTYLAYCVKKWNLRPLVVHFDNGWNSEIANKNIENIINKLGFDLYTIVVDWNEFRDLQLSYIKAGVIDIEALTDHAIIATMNKLAIKNNVHYILSGSNCVTESTLPKSWIWSKTDHTNIQSIHKNYGTVKLETYPFFDFYLKKKVAFHNIKTFAPLNYIDYNKQTVKDVITKELGWMDYGGKHYESIFTKFYQGYILPKKFYIDKRKAHLSDLIFGNQITKEEALLELQNNPVSENFVKVEKEYVLKKLGLSEEWFNEWIKIEGQPHSNFEVEDSVWNANFLTKKIGKMLKRI